AKELVAAGDREMAAESVEGAKRAIADYEKALPLARDEQTRAGIHMELANAAAIADPPRVIPEIKEWISASVAAGDRVGAIEGRIMLTTLGSSSREEQIPALRDLVAEAHAAGARRAEASAASALGNRLLDSFKLEEAIQALEGGVAVVDDKADPGYA